MGRWDRGTWRQMLLGLGVAGIALGPASKAIATPQVLYSETFDTDPGWITDQSENFYWNTGSGTYFARTYSGQPEYRPNRFGTIDVDNFNPNEGFSLTWDQKLVSRNGNATTHFGLYSSDLETEKVTFTGLPHIVPDSTVNFSVGRSGLEHREFNIVDTNGASWGGGGASSPLFAFGEWYQGTLEYDSEAHTVRAAFTNKDTGSVVYNATRSVPASEYLFSSDMTFLGVANDPIGYHPNQVWANDQTDYLETEFDNVVLRGEKLGVPDVIDLARAAEFAYCTDCSVAPSSELVPKKLRITPFSGLQIVELEHASGKVVLAIRGTDREGMLSFASNLHSDRSWATGIPSSQFRLMIEAAVEHFNNAVSEHGAENIILTGHSLGGAIAQALGAASGVETATFNAPGMAKMMDNLASELAPVEGSVLSDAQIANYRLYGDRISGVTRNHIGTVVTYDNPRAHAEVDEHAVKSLVSDHQMAKLVSQIDLNAPSQVGYAGDLDFIQVVKQSAINAGTWFYETAITNAIFGANSWAWLDPPAAYGYVVETGVGDPLIRAVSPTFYSDTIGYKLDLWDGDEWVFADDILPMDPAYVFAGPGVNLFRLFVYDFALNDYIVAPWSFIPGLQFAEAGTFTGSITLLNRDGSVAAPEPSTLGVLFVSLLGGAFVVNRRRSLRA